MKSRNLNDISKKYDLSIILPCYNEEKNISILCSEYKKLKKKNYKIKTELILVNNGSSDNTYKEILREKRSNKDIKLFNIKKNQGYGGGILHGIFKSKGIYVSWTHADCQCKLEDIFKLYLIIKNKKNIFGKGHRINKRHYVDELVSRTHSFLSSKILGIELGDINAQPKIFHHSFIKSLEKAPKYFTTLDTYAYYLAKISNLEIVQIKVNFTKRFSGKSKWKTNPFKIFYTIMMNMVFLVLLRLKFIM